MIDERILDDLPLTAGLNAAAKRELAARAVLCRFAPGATLWRAGTSPRGLFLVVEGQVRVTRSTAGRRHVVHVEEAGGTLGEVPLFAGGGYPATAVAERRTVCVAIGTDAIQAAVREDSSFAFALLARLAGRVRHLVDRLDRLAARNVNSRLADYLLARRREVGRPAFTLGRTQAEVAEELGTVREVVVRGLRELREAGIIRAAGRGRFEVADPAALARLAGVAED